MKSEWMVTSNPIGGTTMYGVYRVIDTNKPDHSGNRQYACNYAASKKEALAIADMLNKK